MSYLGWRRAGFLHDEAQELMSGDKPDEVYSSIPAQSARQHRREWIDDLISRGWSRVEIIKETYAYYRRSAKRSPWDFIRLEYKPREKKDFHKGMKAREEAKARVARLYR